jgi:hypothetical protein
MVMTGWNSHLLPHVLRHVVEVAAVALGQDHIGQARRVGRQHLLLEPADRQHAALQRDLAGHADRVLDRRPDSSDASAVVIVTPALGRPSGSRPRARGRGTRSRRTSLVDAQLLGVPAHVAQGDARGLLHDVAELAGQD